MNKDTKTISNEYHELEYAAKELSVPVWQVMKAKEEVGNVRGDVYIYIRTQQPAFKAWFNKLKAVASAYGVKPKEPKYYLGWFEAGYSAYDIADNIDQVHNPGHP